MQTVGDIDRVLQGAEEGVPIAYRSRVGAAATMFGFCALVAEFYQLYNANAARDELEQKIQELRDEAIRTRAEIAALPQPGNLRAYRKENLPALREFLMVLAQGCDAGLPLS